MFDHDEMKSGLLQDLIEKLMEMKEGKPEAHASQMGMDPDQDADDDSSGMMDDPKAKLSILDIKAKPDVSGMGDDADSEDDEEMQKPLAASDFLNMRKKHMGI